MKQTLKKEIEQDLHRLIEDKDHDRVEKLAEFIIDRTLDQVNEVLEEGLDTTPEDEKYLDKIFENTENMNRVFARIGYRQALTDAQSAVNKLKE